MKILTVTENINGIRKKYKFNKYSDTWLTVNKKCNRLEKVKQTVNKKCNRPLIKSVTTKDNKRNVVKEIYSSDSVEVRLSELLLDCILSRNSQFKKPDIQKWAVHIHRMIKIDKRGPQEIEKVIEWCQNDNFWQNNILSTEKLRKQYDQLSMKSTHSRGEDLHQKILRRGQSWLNQTAVAS